jgi:hypothetical protein
MVLPALEHGGYEYRLQVVVGTRLGGRRHRVDVVAKDANGHQILISVKGQQVGGTAEQKVPFEIMCLADTIKCNSDQYHRAYVVLGGEGWTLRQFYLSNQLDRFLINREHVQVVSLEDFVARANKGQL